MRSISHGISTAFTCFPLQRYVGFYGRVESLPLSPTRCFHLVNTASTSCDQAHKDADWWPPKATRDSWLGLLVELHSLKGLQIPFQSCISTKTCILVRVSQQLPAVHLTLLQLAALFLTKRVAVQQPRFPRPCQSSIAVTEAACSCHSEVSRGRLAGDDEIARPFRRNIGQCPQMYSGTSVYGMY
jgi:hypothetical protein